MPISGHLLHRYLLIGLLNVPNIDLKAFFPSIKSSFSQQERRKKMAELVATAALQTLRDLLVEEAGVLAGVGGRVEDVRRQLSRMHYFLKDADTRKDRLSSESVQLWLRKLGDLAIEAEQVLVIHAVEVMSRRETRETKRLMNSLKRLVCILGECGKVRQVGNEVDDIVSRMIELTSWMDGRVLAGETSSNVVECGETSSNVVELSRAMFHLEVEEHFVGMKDDLEDLTSLVTSDERSSRVISICGMGGLGKTTLATKIYQSNTVLRCFDAKAWICVSQQFRPKVIFQQLLKQLLPNESMENMSGDDLVETLYNTQKERKCLVVLDDLWEAEHWNILRRCFPITESSCKVLITSRNEKVAGTERVYKLEGLSEDEGWELLRKIALPVSHSQELSTTDLQKMEEMGREMVRKCGLLPLAISVIGGMLRGETNLREWEKVCTNINSYLRHGRGMDKYDRVGQVLDLSYDALPYHLKPCFLYLGCFLEDEKIDVEQLYLVWMAEGLISLEAKGRGETSRDVAERYLDELASRCMVQVELDQMSTCKRFLSCRLHDLVREHCLLKAKAKGFLKVVGNEEGLDGSISNGVPRLVVYWDSRGDYKWTNPHLNSRLRALMIRKGVGLILENLESFKYLKILELEELEFKNGKLPKGINKLVLLRHLKIVDCNLDILPRAVCKLPYLQSMHLGYLDDLGIPNLMHRLKNLTYLEFFDCSRRKTKGSKKLKLGGLNKLETLLGFDSKRDDVTDLLKLKKLRILRAIVWDEKSLRSIIDHVCSHEDQFCDIDLSVWCDINSDEQSALLSKILQSKPISSFMLGGSLRNLPKCSHEFGQNLTTLTLYGCKMVEDPMETFENLPVLRELHLMVDAFLGTEMTCRAGGFPQLKKLELIELDNLEDWGVEKEAMPHLSSLTILNCKKLKMIPDGLKFITCLQELDIGDDMPIEFRKRVGEGGEDYDKIKHVPTVRVCHHIPWMTEGKIRWQPTYF